MYQNLTETFACASIINHEKLQVVIVSCQFAWCDSILALCCFLSLANMIRVMTIYDPQSLVLTG